MESPKTDCETLMSSVLPFAKKMLDENGEFYPYGAAMRADKGIISVANYDGQEHPQSVDVIDGLKKIFVAGGTSGEFMATALISDVRVTLPSDNTKSDAISVSLDHREGYSVVVFFPYKLEKGVVTVGTVFAQKGKGDIFPAKQLWQGLEVT
jgi:hypothetical protein